VPVNEDYQTNPGLMIEFGMRGADLRIFNLIVDQLCFYFATVQGMA